MARNKGLSFYKRKKKIKFTVVKEILSWLFGIVVAIFIAGVMVYFLGTVTSVVGVSMEPGLYNGQRILINSFQYVLSSPKKKDVVVFLPNGNENTHYYVKRVVGVPGDKILIKEGVLYINGLASSLIPEKILDGGIAENELLLKNGEYFCMGDNPNNSEDSRSANIGPVKDTEIIGKAWFHLKCSEDGYGFVK